MVSAEGTGTGRQGRSPRSARSWPLALVLLWSMAACQRHPTPTALPTSTPGPTALPAGAVARRADLRKATVRIEAQGSFEDPTEGSLRNAAGTGSGFLIDPSGIAVTNNHVVSGAGILKVYLDGETTPRSARKLGMSECSDLALIDIDGEDLPYLVWRDAPVEAGLDVFAGGYPLGDPEFTLTKGIISKERANGDMPWASVARVLEHDARIAHGSSGGPLVDDAGRVVGVNFANEPATNRNFAIGRDMALPLLDRLRQRENVAWIGVNGLAVSQGEDASGIWVSSVDSGSPADLAGLDAGDVILRMEGLDVGADGSMAAYCDIVRGHFPEDKLKLEVLRGGDLLEGYVNGPKLEPVTSFARVLPTQLLLPPAAPSPEASLTALGLRTEAPDGQEPEVAPVTETPYVLVKDDSAVVALDVPAAWSEVDGGPWTDESGTVVGAAVMASVDLEAFKSGQVTSGVFFGASQQLAKEYDPAALLDRVRRTDVFDSSKCDLVSRNPYQDPLYKGVYDVFTACDDTEAGLVLVAAQPQDGAYITLLMVRLIAEADAAVLDQVLDSFQVVGPLP